MKKQVHNTCVKRILPVVFLIIVLIIVFFKNTSVYNRAAVLANTSKPIIMPPTAEGPGLILPDSPFYFLDKLKQEIRLDFAFTPESKAKVYASIAGERIAEFRFELAKNNIQAADIALQGLRENTKNAADQIALAKFSGKNVDTLASDINKSIKEHQQALDFVTSQAKGETKVSVAFAQTTLDTSKKIVENALPKEELDNEIRDDTIRNAKQSAENTADDAEALQTSLTVLQQQATEAAKNNLQKRQDALQKAIDEKNNQLKKIEEVKLDEEKRKEDVSRALQNQAATQAQDIVQKAQDLSTKIQNSLQVLDSQ